MKIIRKANGKESIKLSKSEWESIGKTAGWDDDPYGDEELAPDVMKEVENIERDVEKQLKKDKKAPIPEELKKEKKYKKKDPAEWAADRTEKSQLQDKEKKQKEDAKRQKFLKKEVYDKPPIK